MSAQATLGGFPEEIELRTDLEEDPTPRGVVKAVLRAAMRGEAGHELIKCSKHYTPPWGPTTMRVADIGAGFGCWSSQFRQLALAQGWPVHITGIEINPEREEHLAKWCDEVVIRDWFEALRDHHELPTWDLIVGNPPFGQLLSDTPKDYYDEFADLLGGDDWPIGMPGWLLEHAPAVLLLHTQQAFLRSEAGRACWRRHPPAASWLVPGGVKFRGPGVGSDARCYQVTLWLRGHSGPCAVHLLDDLTAKERAWSVIPGSESPDVARALGLPMVGDG